jgi:hypothetical protein
VRLIRLDEGDHIAAVAVVMAEEEDDGEDIAGDNDTTLSNGKGGSVKKQGELFSSGKKGIVRGQKNANLDTVAQQRRNEKSAGPTPEKAAKKSSISKKKRRS